MKKNKSTKLRIHAKNFATAGVVMVTLGGSLLYSTSALTHAAELTTTVADQSSKTVADSTTNNEQSVNSSAAASNSSAATSSATNDSSTTPVDSTQTTTASSAVSTSETTSNSSQTSSSPTVSSNSTQNNGVRDAFGTVTVHYVDQKGNELGETYQLNNNSSASTVAEALANDDGSDRSIANYVYSNTADTSKGLDLNSQYPTTDSDIYLVYYAHPTITIYYVDENGNDIALMKTLYYTGTDYNVNIVENIGTADKPIFDEQVKVIDGYQFTESVYGSDGLALSGSVKDLDANGTYSIYLKYSAVDKDIEKIANYPDKGEQTVTGQNGKEITDNAKYGVDLNKSYVYVDGTQQMTLAQMIDAYLEHAESQANQELVDAIKRFKAHNLSGIVMGQEDLSLLQILLDSIDASLKSPGMYNPYTSMGVYLQLTQSTIAAHDSTLTVGDTWNAKDNFVSATDLDYSDVDFSTVKVDGTVDTSKAGDYTITYSFVDKGGNTISKTITVHVKAKATTPDKPTTPAKPETKPSTDTSSKNTTTNNTTSKANVVSTATSEKAKTAAAEAKKLPQTGEESPMYLTVLGIIITGMIGLAEFFNRKKGFRKN